MPNNACQRCAVPLQPSETGLCESCATPLLQFLWREVWPSMEECMHRYLPAALEAMLRELVAQRFTAAWNNAPTVGLTPHIPLHVHVQAGAARWRTVFAGLEAVRSSAGGLPPPVQLAGLTCLGVAIRDLARQYVSQYYNFDMDQKRFVPGDGGPPLTLDGDMLLSKADISSLVAACLDAALCENMLLAGLQALGGSRGSQHLEGKAGSECMQAAVDAMLALLQSAPLCHGTLMESPFEYQQEQGMLSVAGWAATQISLEHNRRLRHALAHDDIAVNAPRMSEFPTLCEQLPAHTYEAWYQEGWSTLAELRTRIASSMEQDGVALGLTAHLTPDSLRQAQQELSSWGSNTSLEEFAARQEVSQRLDEVATRAGLSPREADVLALQRHGLTQAQIGEQLHLPRTTVKTYRERVAEKMYKAAQR